MSKKNNKLSDMDIVRMIGIAKNTLQDWKNTNEDNWRNKLYTFLKSHTYSELELKLSTSGTPSSTPASSGTSNLDTANE